MCRKIFFIIIIIFFFKATADSQQITEHEGVKYYGWAEEPQRISFHRFMENAK